METDTSVNVKTKILLVDDKVENLIALEKVLQPLNLEVIKATSGNEALKLLLIHQVAVVLLDVMMPDMNGYEMASLMHNNELTLHIPIIFLTALNKSEQYMLKGLEVGAVDYLYKPIDPVVLLSKVRVFVDLYELKNELENTIKTLNNYQRELVTTNQKLKKLSEEDSLTEIPNRRNFEMKFTTIIELAKNNNRAVLLVFIDLDNFKIINDQYGHKAGDAILKFVAENLRIIMRVEDDIMFKSDSDTFARIGGDEFVIVVSDISSPAHADQIVERIESSLNNKIFDYEGQELKISLSIGMACYPTSGDTLDELMHAADVAMYRKKQSKKEWI